MAQMILSMSHAHAPWNDNMEKTVCDYGANPSLKAFNCEREEQCDDCWMVDYLKECKGCEFYDHPEQK